MKDYSEYIGIPFKPHGRDKSGYDCIGLVLAVFKDQGITIPDVWTYDTPESKEVASNFLVEMAASDVGNSSWVRCEPQEGAIVLFKIAGLVRHIGYMISPTKFLHVMSGTETCIESIDNPLWKKRMIGTYKWYS